MFDPNGELYDLFHLPDQSTNITKNGKVMFNLLDMDSVEPLVRLIERSNVNRCANESSYKLTEAKMIQNESLKEIFEERKQEMIDGSLIEKYAFYLTLNDHDVYKIAIKGFACSPSDKDEDNLLGSSCFGVHLVKHLDVGLLRNFLLNNHSVNVVLVKYVVSNFCLVKPNAKKSLFPNSDVDCHFSVDLPSLNDPIDRIYSNSLVYLYEYDIFGMPMNKPRNLLPIAWFKYSINRAFSPGADYFLNKTENLIIDDNDSKMPVDDFDIDYEIPSRWRELYEKTGLSSFKLKSNTVNSLSDEHQRKYSPNNPNKEFLLVYDLLERWLLKKNYQPWSKTDMKQIKAIKQSIRREISSLFKASLNKYDDCDPASLDIEPSITQDMIIDQQRNSVGFGFVKSTVQEQLSDPFKLNDLIKTAMSGVECLRIYDHFDSKSNGKKKSLSFRMPSRDVKRQRNRHINRVVSKRQSEREKREETQNRHRRKDQQKASSSKRVSFASSSFERFVKPKYKEKFDHRGRETSKSYKSASTSKASKTSKTTRGEEQISKTPNVFGTDISDLNTNNNRQQYYFNTAPIYNYSQNVYFENEKNQFWSSATNYWMPYTPPTSEEANSPPSFLHDESTSTSMISLFSYQQESYQQQHNFNGYS